MLESRELSKRYFRESSFNMTRGGGGGEGDSENLYTSIIRKKLSVTNRV